MHINTQIKMDDIEVNPLTLNQKQQIIEDSFGKIAQLNAENISLFLAKLQIAIKQYLIEYNTNWKLFEQSFQLMNKISELKDNTENLNSSYMQLRNQQGNKEYAERFIQTLEKGNFLLEYIRSMLTGQNIITNFTIKNNNDEIYYVDKSQASYKLVLSTYGASGNNFVSLAYKIDIPATIQELKNSAYGINNNITGTDIYSRIMQIKDEYLKDLEKKAIMRGQKKSYIPRYDSTDAEIFDLLKQRLESGDIQSLNRALTLSTYQKMRRTMGGRGGYRTSSTQLGDIGLTQDKMVTQQINRVNFARQTLIYNRFKDMDTALSSLDKNTIKQMFLSLFTEKQSRVGDNISKAVNSEAKKLIKDLFK